MLEAAGRNSAAPRNAARRRLHMNACGRKKSVLFERLVCIFGEKPACASPSPGAPGSVSHQSNRASGLHPILSPGRAPYRAVARVKRCRWLVQAHADEALASAKRLGNGSSNRLEAVEHKQCCIPCCGHACGAQCDVFQTVAVTPAMACHDVGRRWLGRGRYQCNAGSRPLRRDDCQVKPFPGPHAKPLIPRPHHARRDWRVGDYDLHIRSRHGRGRTRQHHSSRRDVPYTDVDRDDRATHLRGKENLLARLTLLLGVVHGRTELELEEAWLASRGERLAKALWRKIRRTRRKHWTPLCRYRHGTQGTPRACAPDVRKGSAGISHYLISTPVLFVAVLSVRSLKSILALGE